MKSLLTVKGINDFSVLIFRILFLCGIAVVFFTNTIFSQTLWNEDWEGNWSSNWYVDGGTWEVGIPTSGPDSAFDGQNCAATVLAGNYSEPVDTRLIRFTSFTVPPASENPRLRFWYWFSFNAADYGQVQIKTSNGQWEPISIVLNNYGSNAWSYGSVDISDYADSTVQIAFYFHSENYLGGASDVSTGWYIDDVSLITGPYVLNSPESFESGFGDWSVDEGSWEVGIPTSGPSSAHSGQYCTGTNLEGNYEEPADSRLISPPFMVPPASENPRFRFWYWFSFNGADYGQVQIKTSNGQWEPISIVMNNYGSNAWSYGSVDISDYADSTVQIAFYFHSENYLGGASDVSTGWYIDDVSLITGPYVLNSPESFESGFGDWSVDEGSWEAGTPISGPDTAYSGSNCVGTNLEGNYEEPADSRLISPPFLIPADSINAGVQYWHWYSFNNGDWGEVQISVDNGNWQTISPQFTNTSSGVWTNYYIALSAYAGSIVRIAFNFHSENYLGGASDVSTGWYIDQITFVGVAIIPVELVSFTSGIIDGNVNLNWSTATETNNRGFEIQRRTDKTKFTKIGFVKGSGTTTEHNEYSYLDKPANSEKYYYRLKQTDYNGSFKYSKVIDLEYGMPDKYSLSQNYPNPFNPTTKISWQSPVSSRQVLKIFDVLGRAVATLVNEYKPAGKYEINFDASNFPSGIYFYKLQSGNFAEVKKMILLK